MDWFDALGMWSVRPFIDLSPVGFLGVVILARYTVGREWRVPWAVTTGIDRAVCLVRSHDPESGDSATWCARCGRDLPQPGKASR